MSFWKSLCLWLLIFALSAYGLEETRRVNILEWQLSKQKQLCTPTTSTPPQGAIK